MSSPSRRRGPLQSSARQRVLSQWRGAASTLADVEAKARARKAGDVMSKVFAEFRIDGRRADAEIVKVWNASLDPAIAAHAQPTGLQKGTLFVSVDSNAWLSEIVRYRRREILDRLQHSFGAEFIKKISFRVG